MASEYASVREQILEILDNTSRTIEKLDTAKPLEVNVNSGFPVSLPEELLQCLYPGQSQYVSFPYVNGNVLELYIRRVGDYLHLEFQYNGKVCNRLL